MSANTLHWRYVIALWIFGAKNPGYRHYRQRRGKRAAERPEDEPMGEPPTPDQWTRVQVLW